MNLITLARHLCYVVLCGLMIVSSTFPITHAADSIFTDVDGYPYQDSIISLSMQWVVKGYPDGKFKPDRAVTRAEIMKIILEAALGSEVGTATDCFSDVHDEWFAKYVCYARNHQIVRGYPDGEFKPDNNVTFAEALKMSLEGFSLPIDEGSGNDRYQPYLDFVHDNTIFSKYAIDPRRTITRGEMAHLVHQLLLEKQGYIKFTQQRDSSSPGCGLPPPTVTPTESQVNGIARHYITDVGKNYDRNTPTKLILAFHGRTNPNTMVRTYYRIQQASNGNAIIVYPAGLPEEGPSRSRSSPGDKSDQLRDFQLFDQLVQEMSETYCIDMDEIYVVGHSLGAWFTNSLACARGNVIRAIGSVGGGTTINDCSGPTAAIIMHNPKDRLSSFGEGLRARDQLLKQNHCWPETIPVGPEDGNCVLYTQCLEGAPIMRCPHSDDMERGTYYPHTRPDFAGEEIWKFFEGLE